MKKILFATAAMAALLGPIGLSAQRRSSNPTPASAAQQTKPAAAASTSTTASPAKPAAAKTHELSGRIVSMTDTSMVVSHGKQKAESTFMLSPDTKREGTLTAGEMVKIDYWTQGKENIATLVRVEGLKTAAQTKAPKSRY